MLPIFGNVKVLVSIGARYFSLSWVITYAPDLWKCKSALSAMELDTNR